MKTHDHDSASTATPNSARPKTWARILTKTMPVPVLAIGLMAFLSIAANAPADESSSPQSITVKSDGTHIAGDLNITGDIKKNNQPWTPPPATATTLGSVKVGGGLSVTPDGTLSTASGGCGGLPNIPALTHAHYSGQSGEYSDEVATGRTYMGKPTYIISYRCFFDDEHTTRDYFGPADEQFNGLAVDIVSWGGNIKTANGVYVYPFPLSLQLQNLYGFSFYLALEGPPTRMSGFFNVEFLTPSEQGIWLTLWIEFTKI
jgi:hypothetical protein